MRVNTITQKVPDWQEHLAEYIDENYFHLENVNEHKKGLLWEVGNGKSYPWFQVIFPEGSRVRIDLEDQIIYIFVGPWDRPLIKWSSSFGRRTGRHAYPPLNEVLHTCFTVMARYLKDKQKKIAKLFKYSTEKEFRDEALSVN